MSQSILPNQKTSKLADRSEVFKAVVREDIPRLRQLLRVPNNVNAINKAGETCLDIALARKKRAAEKLIRECGGLTNAVLAERHGREAPATSLVAAAARLRREREIDSRRVSYSKLEASRENESLDDDTVPPLDEVVRLLQAEMKIIKQQLLALQKDADTKDSKDATEGLGRDTTLRASCSSLPSATTPMTETMPEGQFVDTNHGGDQMHVGNLEENRPGMIMGGHTDKKDGDSRTLATSKSRARHEDIFSDEEAAFDFTAEQKMDEVMPAQVENFEQISRSHWLATRNQLFRETTDKEVSKIKLAYRSKIGEVDQHLSIFQVLWLENVTVWPCHNKQFSGILGKFLCYNERVSFWSWVILMSIMFLVILVQLVVPTLLIKVMVNKNHEGSEALSFCPMQHHTTINHLSCIILIVYLIGNVVTTAPRSRLLCLQYVTYDCTRGDTKYGRKWLGLGYIITTVMQVICTGATYVLFLEYSLLPDLLLNAVALVFILEADTTMSQIYLTNHLTQAAEVYNAKNHWFERARDTKHYAIFGLIAGHSIVQEMRALCSCKLGKTLSLYILVYVFNLSWQLIIMVMMFACY